MRPKSIILCDLENTLTLGYNRLQRLLEGTQLDQWDKEAWGSYYKALENDLPRTDLIETLKVMQSFLDAQVYIFSTRYQTKYNTEVKWLQANNIHYSGLLLRKQGDKRYSDEIIEDWLIDYGDDVIHIFDDRIRRAQMYSTWRIPFTIYPHPEIVI